MRVHNLKFGLLLVWVFLALDTYVGFAQGFDQNAGRQRHGPTYLSLDIDLRRDGSFEIIRANQISGEVILRDAQTSDFIYEATIGAHTLAVAFLPEDPFAVRALADPRNSKERIDQAQSAVIGLTIPLMAGSTQEIRQLRLRIFKLVSGTYVSRVDFSVLQELKKQKKIIVITELPPKTFGHSIARKLSKLSQ